MPHFWFYQQVTTFIEADDTTVITFIFFCEGGVTVFICLYTCTCVGCFIVIKEVYISAVVLGGIN